MDDLENDTPPQLYDEWQRAKTLHEVLLITHGCAPPNLPTSMTHLEATIIAEIERAKARENRAWEDYWASLKR